MNMSKLVRGPKPNSKAARLRCQEKFWLVGALILLSLGAIHARNARAQEAVKALEVYSAMKAGFPGNFESIVAGKKVMVFHDVYPVLVHKEGMRLEPRASFDAETYTDSNKQYAAIAYAMRGGDGNAYQIKDKSGRVAATVLIPAQNASDGVLFNLSQDADKITLIISSSSGDGANVGGGGGGGGAGGN